MLVAGDTAIHEIDTCRFLLGEEIVRVRVDTPRATSLRFDHLQDPLVLVAYTESGVRIDDEVNVNLQFAYSIECELVMESGTVRLGDQEHVHVRDLGGDRTPMCRSHIDRFHAAFNAEVNKFDKDKVIDLGQFIDALARASIMFDGNEQTAVEQARALWKRFKAEGHEISYWKQDEERRWRNQAS